MTAGTLSPAGAPGRSFRDAWLITLGHSLTHWYPATFYLLLPLIGKELGLSYGQIGLIMTCQYIAGAIANVPGGMLVDTVGRKGLLMASSLFWVGFPLMPSELHVLPRDRSPCLSKGMSPSSGCNSKGKTERFGRRASFSIQAVALFCLTALWPPISD